MMFEAKTSMRVLIVLAVLLCGGVLMSMINVRPVENTFVFPEGDACLIGPPLRPDPASTQSIIDAASLEAALREQFLDQAIDVTEFELFVALFRPVEQVVCYPADAPETFHGSLTCTSFTDDLVWDSGSREGMFLKIENGGNGTGLFAWQGEEQDPPCYNLQDPFLQLDQLRAPPYDALRTSSATRISTGSATSAIARPSSSK